MPKRLANATKKCQSYYDILNAKQEKYYETIIYLSNQTKRPVMRWGKITQFIIQFFVISIIVFLWWWKYESVNQSEKNPRSDYSRRKYTDMIPEHPRIIYNP